jgi:predicted AAA+ superfamily ATPase
MIDTGSVVRNPEQQTENKTIEHMETNKIELPTAPRKATHVNPRDIIIYGKPKVGKTTALSLLENCLN